MPCEADAVQHRCVSQMAAAAQRAALCSALSRRYQESTPHDDETATACGTACGRLARALGRQGPAWPPQAARSDDLT